MMTTKSTINIGFMGLTFLLVLLILLGTLVTVAFLTLLERKFLSGTQNRRGPNVVGWWGLMQPFADALKLLQKESIFPYNARTYLFIMSPLISFFFALLGWAFIPFSYNVQLVDSSIALFFIFTFSVLHTFGLILAGWASGSRYSFLGAMRSSAQLISYEISLGALLCAVTVFTKTLNLVEIVEFQEQMGYLIFYLPHVFVLFFVCALAETNRHPFDLPEAESELVGGYNTEYSSAYFAFFFLAEYCSILQMVFLIVHLFLGGWAFVYSATLTFLLYSLKILVVYYLFLVLRAAIPRYRYDQLMRLGWKVVLPLSLAFLANNVLITLVLC